MVPLAVYEWPDRADSAKSRVLSGTVEWATNIFRRLDDAAASSPANGRDGPDAMASTLQTHLAWPRRVIGIVQREIRGEWAADVAEGVSVLRLDLPISPESTTVGSDTYDVDVDFDGEIDGEDVGVVNVSDLGWGRFWGEEDMNFGGAGLNNVVDVLTINPDLDLMAATATGHQRPDLVLGSGMDLGMELL
jgi:hypothetical protein